MADGYGLIPQNAIIIWVGVDCPEGYARFSALDDRFPLGTAGFPGEEKYSLVDQIRRASRSVCANLSEAWRKRRYVAVFRNKTGL